VGPASETAAVQPRRSGRAPTALKVLFGLLATSPETRAPPESPDLPAHERAAGSFGRRPCWRVRPAEHVVDLCVAAPSGAGGVLKEIDAASLLTPGPARRRGAQPPAAPEPVHPRACSRAVPRAASPCRCRRYVAARSASHCLCQRHPRSREGDRRDECAACEPGASSGRGVSARSSRAPTGALAGAPDVVRAQQRSKGRDWVPPLRPSKPPKKPPNPGRSGGSVGTPPPAGPTPRPEGCQCWTERRKGWVASSTRTPVNSSRHPVLDRAGKGMAVACPHRRRRSQPSMRLARGQSRGPARWDCRALARRPPHPSRCPRARPATAWSKSRRSRPSRAQATTR